MPVNLALVSVRILELAAGFAPPAKAGALNHSFDRLSGPPMSPEQLAFIQASNNGTHPWIGDMANVIFA